MAHTRERCFEIQAAQRLDHRRNDRFQRGQHLVLTPEGSLQVQLSEFDLAVRSKILVAVAPGDLVVTLHASDHQQLLEQLGRLREGVERAPAEPAGNQEIAGTLRSRLHQGRSLHLEEAVVCQSGPHRLEGSRTGQEIGRHPRTTEVQVSEFEAPHLVDIGTIVDLERKRIGGRQHGDLRGAYLNLPRRQVGVDGPFGPGSNRTQNRDAELVSQGVSDVVEVGLLLGVDDHLHDAAGVTQVHKQDATVIAPGRHPARHPHLVAYVFGAQKSGMCRPQRCFIHSSTSSTGTLLSSPVPNTFIETIPADHSVPTMETTSAPDRLAALN